jgi:hypothetical protein
MALAWNQHGPRPLAPPSELAFYNLVRRMSRPDDLFMTPYTCLHQFQTFAMRPQFAATRFHPMSPGKVRQWHGRLDDLTKGELSRRMDELMAIRWKKSNFLLTEILQRNYDQLTRDDLCRLARKYGICYYIKAAAGDPGLPVRLRYGKYRVFDLTPCLAGGRRTTDKATTKAAENGRRSARCPVLPHQSSSAP